MTGAVAPVIFLLTYFKLLSRGRNFRTSVIAHVTAQVFDQVDQELDHVLRIVNKRTRDPSGYIDS